MKNFPETVPINGKEFLVIYNPDAPGDDWGGVDHPARIITVFAGEKRGRRLPIDTLDTLLHEILHAELATNEPLHTVMIPDGSSETEETIVSGLATRLSDILVGSGMVELPKGVRRERSEGFEQQ